MLRRVAHAPSKLDDYWTAASPSQTPTAAPAPHRPLGHLLSPRPPALEAHVQRPVAARETQWLKTSESPLQKIDARRCRRQGVIEFDFGVKIFISTAGEALDPLPALGQGTRSRPGQELTRNSLGIDVTSNINRGGLGSAGRGDLSKRGLPVRRARCRGLVL
eukprot:1190536-Prorocentrum_minimum.AAC.1